MTHKKRKIYDTNRTMARRPKRGQGWCYGCDMAIVGDGQKCPVRGNRNVPKRNKKEDREE